jgi:hypothetical protein
MPVRVMLGAARGEPDFADGTDLDVPHHILGAFELLGDGVTDILGRDCFHCSDSF